MKFLAGLLCGLTLSAMSSTPIVLDMTHHDAAGRTQHATARLESLQQVGYTVFAVYQSDSLFCSALEP